MLEFSGRAQKKFILLLATLSFLALIFVRNYPTFFILPFFSLMITFGVYYYNEKQLEQLKNETMNSFISRFFFPISLLLICFLLISLFNAYERRPLSYFIIYTIFNIFFVVGILFGNLKPKNTWIIIFTIAIFARFSIYSITQTYIGVDPWRDFYNANLIIKNGALLREKFAFEMYYKPFPLVPIFISSLSLISGLPLDIAHISSVGLVEALGLLPVYLITYWILDNKQASYLSAWFYAICPPIVMYGFTVIPQSLGLTLYLIVLMLIFKSFISGMNKKNSILILIFTSFIVITHGGVALITVLTIAAFAIFLGVFWQISESHDIMFINRILCMCTLLILTYWKCAHSELLNRVINPILDLNKLLIEFITGTGTQEHLHLIPLKYYEKLFYYVFWETLPIALSVGGIFLGPIIFKNNKRMRLIFLFTSYFGLLMIFFTRASYLLSPNLVTDRYIGLEAYALLSIGNGIVLYQLIKKCKKNYLKVLMLLMLGSFILSTVLNPSLTQDVNPIEYRYIVTSSEKMALSNIVPLTPKQTIIITDMYFFAPTWYVFSLNDKDSLVVWIMSYPIDRFLTRSYVNEIYLHRSFKNPIIMAYNLGKSRPLIPTAIEVSNHLYDNGRVEVLSMAYKR